MGFLLKLNKLYFTNKDILFNCSIVHKWESLTNAGLANNGTKLQYGAAILQPFILSKNNNPSLSAILGRIFNLYNILYWAFQIELVIFYILQITVLDECVVVEG